MNGALGQPNLITVAGFFIFIAISLRIIRWPRAHAQHEQFYTAGRRITGLQNGLALAATT